ncbi:MAG: outer membrane beta-barrel protein, partial [Vicingaceae bacterium]
GTDDPDSSRRMRYFSNFFTDFKVGERLGVIVGFDYGLQEMHKNASTYDYWYCPSLIALYNMSKKWKTAIRLEYFEDNDQVIIPTSGSYGFKATGASINFDYLPEKHIQCRLEARWLNSPNALFNAENSYKNESLFIGTSMAIKIGGSMNTQQ